MTMAYAILIIIITIIIISIAEGEQMSKTFLLHLPDAEHQALKIAAVQSSASMNQFIRDAIAEKIARQHMEQPAPAADALNAKDAEHSASGDLAEADEKRA